jgi:hypothetical protein
MVVKASSFYQKQPFDRTFFPLRSALRNDEHLEHVSSAIREELGRAGNVPVKKSAKTMALADSGTRVTLEVMKAIIMKRQHV